MLKTNQNEQLIKIGSFVSARTNKYEVIIVLIFLLGLVLQIATDLKVNFIIVFALNLLGALYFLNAFAITEDEHTGGMEIFINKLVSIASNVTIIAILFRLLHWSGYNTMLPVGCIILVILLPVILTIKSRKPDLKLFSQRLVIRIALIAAFGLFLNFAPADTLIKIGLDKRISVENEKLN